MDDSAWVAFNINESVKVRLTEFGLACLKQGHDELNEFCNGALGEFKPPAVDEQGRSKFQLWTLFADLGKHIAMGRSVPFETTIFLDGKAMRQNPIE